ncbi:Ig-like domain-containing protein [Treponema primitia]|uniref:Ig-like domain-containing protein n=1 Tax=Treponema primitia TaxID=88058 RepID=UPI00397EE44B
MRLKFSSILSLTALLSLLSCENPIQAGLGTRVDIKPPTVSIESPVPGKFIKGGNQLFQIKAEDDIAVVHVCLAFVTAPDGSEIPKASWEWIMATLDPETLLWNTYRNTNDYEDGQIRVRARASDNSGKDTISEELVYTIKNGFPTIEVQVPSEPDPGKKRELVAGGVMIGIAADLWGIAPGYPKIQFWPADGTAPDPALDTAWEDMDRPEATQWNAAAAGKTAMEFRFDAVDHSSEDRNPLRPGMYRFRYKVLDMGGQMAYYPPIAVDSYPAAGPGLDYFELEIITARELPVITFKPLTNQFQREPFYISAELSHSLGIFSGELTVQKEGEAGPTVLAREVFSDNTALNDEKFYRILESFRIDPGEPYIYTDVVDGALVSNYTFDDGAYDFTITTASLQGSEARRNYTVYIDRSPPEINITRLQPNALEYRPGDGLVQYTVNGFIAVDISSYDANNIAVTPGGNREIKYLLLDTYNPDANPQDLYADAAAAFFDDPRPPVYKRSGSSSSLIIDTTQLVTPADYYAEKSWYLYITARDKAGNHSFTTVQLRVDQSTDIPRVEITGFDKAQRSEALLGSSPNQLGSNRQISGFFTDDDGVFIDSGDSQPAILFKIFQDAYGSPVQKWTKSITRSENLTIVNSKTVEFRLSLPDDPSDAPNYLPDGVYSVEIEVRDSLTEKNVLKPLVSPVMADLPPEIANTSREVTPEKNIYFVLDTAPPALTELQIGNTEDSPKLVWTAFDMHGTVSDTNGLKSLVIKQRELGVGVFTILNTVYPSSPPTLSENWAIAPGTLPYRESPPGTDLRSGTFEYEIIATDIAGRVTTLKRRVVVDLVPPDLWILANTEPPVIQPADGSWIEGTHTTIKGNVKDTIRMGRVFYSIQPMAAGAASAPDIFIASGAAADYEAAAAVWKQPVLNGTEWSDTVALPAEGRYWIYLIAFDAAGNKTTNYSSVLKFGVDQGKPDLDPVKPLTGSIDVTDRHINTKFNLAGTVTDANGLVFVGLEEQLKDELGITHAAKTLTLTPAANYPDTISTAGDVSWDFYVPNIPWDDLTENSTPPDGTYTYTLTIGDKTGRSNRISTKTFTVVYDTRGPVVEVAGPGDGASISGNPPSLYISGNARDALTPADIEVYYIIDTDSIYAAPAPASPANALSGGWFKAEGGTPWFKDVTLNSTEGRRYLHVIAYDTLGNKSSVIADRQFFVDISPPYIRDWTAGASNYAGADYSFSFHAYDSNALAGVKITANGTELSAATGLSIQKDWDNPGTDNPREWLVTVDLTAQGDGVYNYVIDISDTTGKENTDANNPGIEADAHKRFTITVDTTGPVVSVVDPAAGFTVGGSTVSISGTAVDALTPEGVTVWYVIDESPVIAIPGTPTAGDPPTLAGWNLANGGSGWNKSAAIPAGNEGNHYVHVIGYDKLGNKSAVIQNRQFFVDTNPPQINSWAPVGINAAAPYNFAGADYTIMFNAYDSNALGSVKITGNGTELSGADAPGITKNSGKDWLVTLDLRDQPDGNYSYVIEIKDTTGRENTLDNLPGGSADAFKNFTIIVDSTPPETAVTRTPAKTDNTEMADITVKRADNVNGIIRFAASAMDTNGVEGLKWFLIADTDSTPFVLPASAAQAQLQSLYNDPRGQLFDASYEAIVDTTLSPLRDQTGYTLYVLARDKAGNIGYNNTTPESFFVDQRTDMPVVVLSNLSKAAPADSDPVIRDGFILRGTVKDDDGVDTGAIKISLYNGQYWFDGSAWASSAAVPQLIPPGSITGSGREVSFTYTFPNISPDGPNKKVVVTASDLQSEKVGYGDSVYNAVNAVKTVNAETTFGIDTTKPVISLDAAVTTTYKADFQIAGNLTEANLDIFRVRLDSGDFISYTANTNPAANAAKLVLTGTGTDRTWIYRVPALTDTLSQGPHTLTLEAADKVGLSHTLVWTFSLDSEGPEIFFNTIDEKEYTGQTGAALDAYLASLSVIVDSVPVLRGSFVDEYSNITTQADVSNYTFEYRFDSDAAAYDTTLPGDFSRYGKNVSWALPLDGLSDGPHWVQIRAKDELDNMGISKQIGFRIDTLDPVTADILPPGANAVFNGSAGPVFTLSGNTYDANLLSVSVTINNVTTDVTGTVTAGVLNWTYPVTTAVFNALPQEANRINITAKDMAGRTNTVEYDFIKDTAAPTLTFNNLAADNSSLFQDQSSLKILGTARDTNGLAVLTGVLEKWDAGLAVPAFVLIPGSDTDLLPQQGETVVNWVKDLTLLGIDPLDGRYRISINAADRAGNVLAPQVREFRIDLMNPEVSIDSAAAGSHPLKAYYNGKADIGSGPITVSGTSFDANGVANIHARLTGNGAPSWAAADATLTAVPGPNYSYTWVFTIPASSGAEELRQGGYTMTVTAVDDAGRTNMTYGNFTFDSEDPGAVVDLPAKPTRVTGAVTIRGSNSDNFAIDRVEYKLGKNDTWHNADLDPLLTPWGGGFYSWTYAFTNSNAYADISFATEVLYNTNTGAITEAPGTGVWRLPFNVKVIDKAGNEKETDDYFILVNPFMDVPQVTIASPATGSVLGGRVFVSGIATDNVSVHHVEYRVKPNPTGLSDEWNGLVWNTAAITGGAGTTVSWEFDINSDGSLNPLEGQGQRPVLIQVRAVDSETLGGVPHLEGDPSAIRILFDSGVPRIGGELITNNSIGKAYFEGIQVSKTFIFEAEIQDDSGISSIQYWKDGTPSAVNVIGLPNIPGDFELMLPAIKSAGSFIPGKKYMIRNPGSTDWTTIGANTNTAGSSFIAIGPGTGTGTAYEAADTFDAFNALISQDFIYKLRLTIATDTAASYQNKTGYYAINLVAYDNSSPQFRTEKSYNIQIDNFYPFGTYTAPNSAAGWYYLRGAARDFDANSGPVQGLDKVVVYLSRNGIKIPLDELGASHAYTGKIQAVRNTVNPALTTLMDFPADTYSGITIDTDEQGIGADVDLDGYEEAWYDDGPDRVWSARFNTLQLKDGPVTVHYVIFDRAGNAAYYEQPLFIKNHAPAISSVTLGTDIFGNKTIGGIRTYTTGYFTTPAYIARNRRLSFDIAKIDGNGAAHFRITHVIPKEINAADIAAGEVYTITTPGSTDWIRLGAASNDANTTFVAALSSGSGDGRAYKYNHAGGPGVVKQGDFLPNETTGQVNYIDFTNIPDTPNAYFLIKVWDSTVAPGTSIDPGTESQQLSDMVVVRVKIENNDTTNPASRLFDMSPHAANKSKNGIATTLDNAGPDSVGADILNPQSLKYGGLYRDGNNAISGHVEPRGGMGIENSFFLEEGIAMTFAADILSGKVILRGYAADNQRLSGIRLQIGSAAAFNIVRVDTTPALITEGHFRALEAVSGGGIQAYVYDDLSLDGHRAEWAYVWDTQTMPAGLIVGPVTVKAIADDARIDDAGYAAADYTLTPNRSSDTAQSAEHNVNYNTIGMELVPYIREVESSLSSYYRRDPSVFSRTAQGHYPVREGEQITLYGFNFGTAAPGVSINGAAASGMTAPVQGSGTRSIYQSFRVRVDNNGTTGDNNTITSGNLQVFVKGFGAVNNFNNNNASWTQFPNGINNNILKDDAILDVWHFTSVYKSQSEVRYPTMKVGPAGEIGFSFANDYLWFNMPGYEYNALKTAANFMSQTGYEMGWGGYTHNTFAFDARGNTYGAAENIDESSGGYPPNSAHFSFYNRRRGSPASSANTQNNYDGNIVNVTRLETTTIPIGNNNYTMDINRVQNPSMVTSMPNPNADPNDGNNRTSVYLAYYDNITKQIRFRAGTVGANRSLTTGAELAPTGGGNIFTLNGHGLANGTQVYVRKSGGGINRTVPYYAIVRNASTFQLAASPGGPAVYFDNNYWGIAVVGGGLIDITGNVGVRTSVDSDMARYQVVATTGAFLPGSNVTAAVGNAGNRTVAYAASPTNYRPSPHVAIGVVKAGSNDVALLAWYDSAGRNLVFSYNTNPAGNSVSQWQANARPIDEGGGTDVSMAVDSDGGIHLAYYSSDGADLKYAYIPAYNQASAAQTVAVDSYLSVGTRTTIAVGKDAAGNQVPYISYYTSAGTGTTMSARYAYRTDFATGTGLIPSGTDASDMFTGKWEISVVPTANVPSDYKISVGVYTDTNGNLRAIPNASAAGVSADAGTGGTKATRTNLGVSSLSNSTSVYGLGGANLNAVVGYTTDAGLEMAQKK